MAENNVAGVVKAYVTIRDKVAEIKSAHKAQLKPYEEALNKLEFQMLGILNNAGVDSMKTPDGTAYRTEKTSVTIADKSAFMDYVKNSESFELLDVRANKTAVEDFMAEHQDLPPGVNIRREAAVNFRRA